MTNNALGRLLIKATFSTRAKKRKASPTNIGDDNTKRVDRAEQDDDNNETP